MFLAGWAALLLLCQQKYQVTMPVLNCHPIRQLQTTQGSLRSVSVSMILFLLDGADITRDVQINQIQKCKPLAVKRKLYRSHFFAYPTLVGRTNPLLWSYAVQSSYVRRNQILYIIEQCNITLTRGGMYWKLRPPRTERFAEIAQGRSPRAISRVEGCKINAEANLSVLGGRNVQWIPTLVSVITFFFPRRGCFDFSFWPAHCVL